MPSFFFHIAFDLERPSSAERTHSTTYESTKHIQHSKLPETSYNDNNTSKATTSRLTTSSHDWRYGSISQQTISMASVADLEKVGGKPNANDHLANGMSAGPSGLTTKGTFEPCDLQEETHGWGVVRLYRDAEETPGLYDEPTSSSKQSRHSKAVGKASIEENLHFQNEDCTTLCILAVPSYLTPSDFLGFVGEKTRDEVSHFRMIRTERSNRYMVLMKFRNGKKARQWRREWNGKAFDGMEPEHCHVVFVKSVSFHLPPHQPGQTSSFPDMTNDPFTPSIISPSSPTESPAIQHAPTAKVSSTTPARTLTKPAPPPTPALIELPTCPVCLERMDESTGLLTILCQHVFHCSCLQKWKGSGCPVCRYTHSSLPLRHHQDSQPRSANETGESGLNECTICRSETNLWICLICGSVGCGRYDAAHAFAHYESSGHSFAMELDSQRVWDYASDVYVHRIIQDKTDGKFLEMTSTTTHDDSRLNNPADHPNNHPTPDPNHETEPEEEDYVPRSKLTTIGHEYTSLLTSQLTSQRHYFETALSRSAALASRASLAADTATASLQDATAALAALQRSHDTLVETTIPDLERETRRAVKRAEKFETMARTLEREWRDEKAMNGVLMEKLEVRGREVEALTARKVELEEENRDLGFFISGGERLRKLGLQGGGEGGGLVVGEEEVREGTVGVVGGGTKGDDDEGGGAKGNMKGKGKGKGRGKR